jgi:hypothetical protein
MTLAALMAADKEIAIAPIWSEAEPETDYIWFDVPIMIGGVVEAQVIFHGGCYRLRPDYHVTFELRAINGRKKTPLQRVDWRSLSGGHRNKVREGSEVSGKRLTPSHIHHFFLNYSEAEDRMRGSNLPMADDLPQEIQSFESLREFVGRAFRISNIHVVSTPPWTYNLFANG